MGNQKEVQRNFGNKASNYRHSTTHGNKADLDRMIKLLKPKSDSIALDVATGGGHTALKLAENTKKVVAIDITAEMLKEAQSYAMERGINNIEFRIEDVHNLKSADETFDIVASRLAPHHFSDIKVALKEMCRVLKKGGNLYILDCSTADSDEPEKVMNRVELLRDSSHMFSYSKRIWVQLLKELPLKVLHMELYQEQYKLPQWFDRMETPDDKITEIFHILSKISTSCKKLYPYNDEFITTYRIELLAQKI